MSSQYLTGNAGPSPFSPSSCKKAIEPTVVGKDLTIFSRPSCFSRCGFAFLPKYSFSFFLYFISFSEPFFRFPNAFFHGGSGGSIGFGDWEEELGLIFCFNFFIQSFSDV